MYLIIYVIIIGIGILSYRFIAEAGVRSIILQQTVRNRMRCELGQVINNLAIDLKSISEVKSIAAYNIHRKIKTANYISELSMDQIRYFIDHLETEMIMHSKLSGIKFYLYIDKSFNVHNISLLNKSLISDLAFHIFVAWDVDHLLLMEIKSDAEIITITINNTEKTFLERLHNKGFAKQTIDIGLLIINLNQH